MRVGRGLGMAAGRRVALLGGRQAQRRLQSCGLQQASSSCTDRRSSRHGEPPRAIQRSQCPTPSDPIGAWRFLPPPPQIPYRDGKSYNCKAKCSKVPPNAFVFEPAIYSPETNSWTPRGSLAMVREGGSWAVWGDAGPGTRPGGARGCRGGNECSTNRKRCRPPGAGDAPPRLPRNGHAAAVLPGHGVGCAAGGSSGVARDWQLGCPDLLPAAAASRIANINLHLPAGSDTTNDQTAEFFSPPYLQRGPRPVIQAAPGAIQPGDAITLRYASADLVTKAILIRTGAVTHSQAFGERCGWRRHPAPGTCCGCRRGCACPAAAPCRRHSRQPAPACPGPALQTRGRCGWRLRPTPPECSASRRPPTATCCRRACESAGGGGGAAGGGSGGGVPGGLPCCCC